MSQASIVNEPSQKSDGIAYEVGHLPSRHRYFSSDTQLVNSQIMVLPQRGGVTGGTGRPPNSYAVIFDDFSILVDAPFSWCRDAVDWLILAGKPPKRHFLTHRHIPMSADAMSDYEHRDGKIFLLHPADQSHKDARGKADYSDPMTDHVLAEVGLEPYQLRGHTDGSVMLHWDRHGGVLFAGDCAVGPGPLQPDPSPLLQRPMMEQGEQEFCANFSAYVAAKEIGTVLTYHGDWYSSRSNMQSVLENVWTGDPMDPSGKS